MATCMSALTHTCTTRASCQLFHGALGAPQLLHNYLVQEICTQVVSFGAEGNEVAVEIGSRRSFPCLFPRQVSCATCITGACDEEENSSAFPGYLQHTDSWAKHPRRGRSLGSLF